MITATPQPLNNSQLRLVFTGPETFEPTEVTVADMAEARRMWYFYNRLYVVGSFITWLGERENVFNHVKDTARADLAAAFKMVFQQDHQAPLKYICELVLLNEHIIELLAPKVASRYYARYQELILPIINFCHERKGVAHAC